MKLAINAVLLALLVILASAAAPLKQVIVSYPKGTPNSIVEEAKKTILEAGGVITHEYHFIKAFVASASAKILDTVQVLGSDNNVLIEEDSTVHANGS